MSDTFHVDPLLTKLPPPKNELVLQEYFNKKRSVTEYSVEVVTPIIRFVNISVDMPRAYPGDDGSMLDPAYTVQGIFALENDQGEPLWADMHKACCMVADATWPKGIPVSDPATGQTTIVRASEYFSPDGKPKIRYPLRDGNKKYIENAEKNAAFRGVWYVGAKQNEKSADGSITFPRPICQNAQGETCQPHEIGALFKRGCYGRAGLRAYAYDHPKGGKGVSFGLNIVQYWQYGPPIGGMDMATRSAQQATSLLSNAGALPAVAPQSGPNTAIPGAIPGWAPPEQASAQPQQVQPGSFVPPNQAPQGYPRTNSGARPPGV